MSPSQSRKASLSTGPRSNPFARIAVGVDAYPEGQDAVVLAAMIARSTGSDLMLVAVHPDPLVVLPRELGRTAMRKQAEALLRKTREAYAPTARTAVETDWSVPRALERVVTREHRELLVVGSSRRGPEGRVRIGNRTRQLLYDGKCAVAVAPRGLHHSAERTLASIGVGYEGGPESRRALALAGALAAAAGAQLLVKGVVDDRIPAVGWSESGRQRVLAMWEELLEPVVDSLRQDAEREAKATPADADVEVRRGDPAGMLLELSARVDLLIIGSRRWGATARLLLGSVGESLLHDASCPILVVPRPDA